MVGQHMHRGEITLLHKKIAEKLKLSTNCPKHRLMRLLPSEILIIKLIKTMHNDILNCTKQSTTREMKLDFVS